MPRTESVHPNAEGHGGAECRVCERPFTSFRWKPGPRARFKKTEICQTCAKLKNVCQTCILDLQYGLPVAVRDDVLGTHEHVPKFGANRDYFIQRADQKFELTDGTQPGGQLALMGEEAKNDPLLERVARTQPYYERNLPHICSFFVRGECKRGELCPYRHEKPTDPDNPLSRQELRDRYYGTRDPVATKMLRQLRTIPEEELDELYGDATQTARKGDNDEEKMEEDAPEREDEREPDGN